MHIRSCYLLAMASVKIMTFFPITRALKYFLLFCLIQPRLVPDSLHHHHSRLYHPVLARKFWYSIGRYVPLCSVI
ncbi:hypothetical protein BDY19DRAFT_970349 [Irpex rosettiformis]|uniref:Uncharacterized protein n=1 Tax=Irpex rosettiformis TaxID=378272 RepID=A0ACB8TRN8_9APHY|nr:hypothetical protein BDY19DRAFT_970349 [Irpex rosettiformis]